MTKRQFNAALIKAGFAKPLPNGEWSLGQTEFAALIKTNVRTVRRWSSGDWLVPVPVALLLNLMIDTKKSPEDLRP